MTLTLTQPTAQAVVNSIVTPLDAGAAASGRVSFRDAGDTATLALLDSANDNGVVPAVMFVPATAADPSRANIDISGGPWEDSARTVAGTIGLALWEDGDLAEIFRCDVGSGAQDIQMSNPTVANNDPVRLSSYGVQVALAN